MNPPTIIVLAVVVALMAFAIRRMIKKPACSCGDEAGCGGCAGCGSVDAADSADNCGCGCGHEHHAS